jgi:hypothetical protein
VGIGASEPAGVNKHYSNVTLIIYINNISATITLLKYGVLPAEALKVFESVGYTQLGGEADVRRPKP